jgi:hypothetical protein
MHVVMAGEGDHEQAGVVPGGAGAGDHARLRGFGAIALTAVCLYSIFVVVRALVLVAEGTRDRWQFWPALIAIGWTGLWSGIFAMRKWRRLAADRRPGSN